MLNNIFSSSGGATTTSPSSWTSSTLEDIFQTKYTNSIATYWPFAASKTSESKIASGGLPSWAPPVIGVLCGLFGIALLVAGFFTYRHQRRRSQRSLILSQNAKELENSEDRKLMYAGGPASPGPGPVSNSTGVETGANVSTVQDSIDTSVSPRTVESGGDAVYEMHGNIISKSVQTNTKKHRFLKILHLPSFLLTSMPYLPPPLRLRHSAHFPAAILLYLHKAPLNRTQGSPTRIYTTEVPHLYQMYRPYQ